MAIFPKIQSPCPYKGKLSDIMDVDICRLCKREVTDIAGFSDAERVAFLKACTTEVCVTYKFPARAAAAAAMTTFMLATPLHAAADPDSEETVMIVTGGGITDPTKVEFVSDAEDESVPELPVMYDDAQANDRARPKPKILQRLRTSTIPSKRNKLAS